MGAHADILRSLSQQLDRFDHQIKGLIARNDERTALAHASIDHSAAQMTRRDAALDEQTLKQMRAFVRP